MQAQNKIKNKINKKPQTKLKTTIKPRKQTKQNTQTKQKKTPPNLLKIIKDMDFRTLDDGVADWQSDLFTVAIYAQCVNFFPRPAAWRYYLRVKGRTPQGMTELSQELF